MSKPEPFQVYFGEVVLWRDGHQAVVSILIGKRWIRVLSADCRTLFHASCDADELRQLSERTTLEAARRRKQGSPRKGKRLTAATEAGRRPVAVLSV